MGGCGVVEGWVVVGVEGVRGGWVDCAGRWRMVGAFVWEVVDTMVGRCTYSSE